MRYYDISISDESGNIVKEWSSLTLGLPNPNAQDVEFDLISFDASNPMGDSTVTIWGVSLQDIGQNFRFGPGQNNPNGYNIVVKGGMSGGLPLENPSQAGQIFAGNIWQAWGNWVGSDMNVSFISKSAPYTITQPGNFAFNWKAGTPLKDAITTCLQTAIPNATPSVNIGSNYSTSEDEHGVYSTLSGFAQHIRAITQTATAPGVTITGGATSILVFDQTYTSRTIQLAFTDFMGQPVWVGPYNIQMTLVMRGDLAVGNYVQMPPPYTNAPGLSVSTPTSYASYRDQTSFNGTFQIMAIRHVGRFRDPDSVGWATIIQCTSNVPV